MVAARRSLRSPWARRIPWLALIAAGVLAAGAAGALCTDGHVAPAVPGANAADLAGPAAASGWG